MNRKEKIEEILLTDFGCFDDFTVDKLLDLFAVSGRSELLMDFIQWKNKKDNNWLKHIDDKEVDDYLKSINCH